MIDKQATLPGVNTISQRFEPRGSITVDVTQRNPGESIGTSMPVVTCPGCGAPAVRRETPNRVRYIHEYRVTTDHKGHTRAKILHVCTRAAWLSDDEPERKVYT